jgi:threonine-phosphate decarboxylase
MNTEEMNIYRASEALKVPERRIIDLSSPVNHLGPSKKVKAELRTHLKYLKQYPDPECKRMRRHIARALGIDAGQIVCCNDVGELFQAIAGFLNPSRILVPVPTDPDLVERAVRGVREKGEEIITYLFLKEDRDFSLQVDDVIEHMRDCEMALLCNPHYPVGNVLKREEVKKITDAAKDRKCYVIVDEHYIDYVSNESMVDEVNTNPFVIVLRSMASYHSLAGLMFGFAVMDKELVTRLTHHNEITPPNALAQRAAVIAVKDKAFRKETDGFLRTEKRIFEKELSSLGIRYYPSGVHYYVVNVADANELRAFLFRRHILVRDLQNAKGLGEDFIGIALKGHRDNSLLIKAMKDYVSSKEKK